MHRPGAHATRSKILTPNFIEGVISIMYLVSYMKFYMAASRDGNIPYDLSQLPKMSIIVSYIPPHNLL
jgi:hypothetical protein